MRPLKWIAVNILGVLIAVYFVFKFAALLVLWVPLGPIAFIVGLFGSNAVFNLLDRLIGGLDSAAWAVYNRLPRAFAES